ncbi:MAG: AgmX/PglI C-terminal domain-containing protein [Myxococcota bacterium]
MPLVVPRPVAPFLHDLLDPEDLPFRAALGTLTAAAVAFTAWVASTPPRVEVALVDARQVSAYVMDLPRIPLPAPVVIEPMHPRLLDGPAAPPARPRPAGDARGRVKEPVGRGILDLIRTEGPSALSILREDARERATLEEALGKVGREPLARLGEGGVGRRAGADGDAGVDLGRLDAGLGVGLSDAPKVRARVEIDAAGADTDVDSGDAAAIARVVRASQGRITTCVEQSLKRAPGLSGRIEARWSIVAGRVSDVRIVRDTTGDAELGGCVASAVRTFRFPTEITAEVAAFPWVVAGR